MKKLTIETGRKSRYNKKVSTQNDDKQKDIPKQPKSVDVNGPDDIEDFLLPGMEDSTDPNNSWQTNS